MLYEIIRGDENIPIEPGQPVILERKLTPDITARVTIWQGHHEDLGPYGIKQVADDILTIRREPLIMIPYKWAGNDNEIHVPPKNVRAGDIEIDLAGEKIQVICTEQA
jgi:hypothetical protein